VACRTANPTSFLCCVVGSASLLSTTAIFWRIAISVPSMIWSLSRCVSHLTVLLADDWGPDQRDREVDRWPVCLKCSTGLSIAVFPILADVVKVKTGSRSTANWSNDFIRLNGWLRNCFAQLITPLDIDGIGQNWEGSNKCGHLTGKPLAGSSSQVDNPATSPSPFPIHTGRRMLVLI